jgi:tRNA A37 methylthiotransferase MiaB
LRELCSWLSRQYDITPEKMSKVITQGSEIDFDKFVRLFPISENVKKVYFNRPLCARGVPGVWLVAGNTNHYNLGLQMADSCELAPILSDFTALDIDNVGYLLFDKVWVTKYSKSKLSRAQLEKRVQDLTKSNDGIMFFQAFVSSFILFSFVLALGFCC